MIYVLSDDPDGLDELARRKCDLGALELQQLNTSVFDGQQLAFEDLVNACEAVPFLAERRLVVMRQLLSRLEPKPRGRRESVSGQRKAPEVAKALADYLPKLPPSVDLVFLEGERITKLNPLHKALLSAQARFAQTPALDRMGLIAWIERRVASKGARLAPGASQLLAAYASGDLRTLDHELDKLAAYAGTEGIDRRAIEELTIGARETNVYKMADAVAEGHAAPALQQFRALLDAGEHPLYLLTMIVRQFRMLLQAKDLQGQGLRGEAIAGRLHVPTFVAERLALQLRRYPRIERLEEVYRRLLDADVAAKTGGVAVTVSVELLIADLGRPYQESSRITAIARP